MPTQPTIGLHALREHGIDVNSEQLANQWLDHITYPWDEYGFAAYNMRRDLCPPITGAFNNWFRQSLGAGRRAELWAMIAPGAPQVAAAYAYRDGIIDHAEEGVWAQMLWSAMESAAFFLSDTQTLLDIGVNQNSTIVFPLPLDMVKPFVERGATSSVPPPSSSTPDS